MVSASYLAKLNPEQRRAVDHGVREGVADGGGPLLVIAGAGSGKTSTLAHRVAYVILKCADNVRYRAPTAQLPVRRYHAGIVDKHLANLSLKLASLTAISRDRVEHKLVLRAAAALAARELADVTVGSCVSLGHLRLSVKARGRLREFW